MAWTLEAPLTRPALRSSFGGNSWLRATRVFARNRLVLAVIMVVLLVVTAVFAGLIAP